MAKPLRSEQTTRPQDVQFAHFGVLNTGAQSKASLFTSVTLNAAILLIAILIGAATKATIEKKQQVTLVVPITEKKPEPPKPVVKPPKPLPPTPKIKPEPPKIKLPDVKMPEPPKIPEMKMAEVKLPPVAPAPPKAVVAAAAPKPTAVSLARSASVVNNDTHPTAVRLGSTTAPAVQAKPSTTAISLYTATTHEATSGKPTTVALGMAGMPGSNTGNGPRATAVNMGSGQPTGSIGGSGKRAVEGVKLGGVTGGTPGGTGNGVGTRAVQLGQVAQPAMPAPAVAAKPVMKTGPEVVYKPRPVYTAEATAMHLEGVVSVRIRVSASGTVQVLEVTSGLGHGLDESAKQAIAATRFHPAHDAAGNPIDWEGVVKVTFQLAT